MVGNPSSATGSPLAVGSLISTGLRAAIDDAGRPLHPALFVTDLTVLGASSTAGDWQIAGGTGVSPNAVYGSWKGAVMVIDSTKAPPTKAITPRADPAKNHQAGIPDFLPNASVPDLGYSAEIVWNISAIPGFDVTHNYRLQFMVHDGDQNKTGGDVGQACMNVGPGSTDPLGPIIH
jgi:hypothetical protein